MMFAILFGLSMDYEVFLMTHIKEAWERTHDNTQAVIDGVAHTGRVITSAALIMVSVFFAFVINGDPTVKQFGVGMGVAVAVDATFVRCLLVPAVMTCSAARTGGSRGWLDRIVPNFSIEGDEWFRERDAGRAAPTPPPEEPPPVIVAPEPTPPPGRPRPAAPEVACAIVSSRPQDSSPSRSAWPPRPRRRAHRAGPSPTR